MATQYAKAQYMEVVDMQTKNGKTTVIGIHTPQGATPYLKLKGFFTQFRKYRYKGIKALHVRPASGLPIDPLGLTVQVGSSDQMNPQDTFNPILFKGCHGEHMRAVLDKFLNNSEYVSAGGTPSLQAGTGDEISGSLRGMDFDNIMDTQYYQCLTDVTWKKFGVQSGFTLRNLHPLVWKMARNVPLNPSAGGYNGTAYETNAGEYTGINAGKGVNPATYVGPFDADAVQPDAIASVPQVGGGNEYVQEFTNGCARLGWLPTTTYVQGSASPQISALPKLFMGMLVLPPSYSCEQYMRAVLIHEFEFKDFSTSVAGMDSVNVPIDASVQTSNAYWNWIDYQTSKGGSIDVLNGDVDLKSEGVA